MSPEVLRDARRQIGIYLQDIMKQRLINRTELATKAGISREQLAWVLRGDRDITFNTFLKVIHGLDCYFFLADREGKHLDQDHIISKMDEDKAMDFGGK